MLEYYKYDLYGKPTYFSSTSQPLNSSTYGVKDLFTGQRWIPELGLYDDRNRFMSPDLGRFLQPDPIGFKGDSSNLYRYCGNDWANRTDPMGTGPGSTSNDTSWAVADLQREHQDQHMGQNMQRPLDPSVATIWFRNPQQDMQGFTMGQVNVSRGSTQAAADKAGITATQMASGGNSVVTDPRGVIVLRNSKGQEAYSDPIPGTRDSRGGYTENYKYKPENFKLFRDNPKICGQPIASAVPTISRRINPRLASRYLRSA